MTKSDGFKPGHHSRKAWSGTNGPVLQGSRHFWKCQSYPGHISVTPTSCSAPRATSPTRLVAGWHRQPCWDQVTGPPNLWRESWVKHPTHYAVLVDFLNAALQIFHISGWNCLLDSFIDCEGTGTCYCSVLQPRYTLLQGRPNGGVVLTPSYLPRHLPRWLIML